MLHLRYMEETTLGLYLQKLMDERHWSHRELSRRAGVSNATISRLVQGLQSPSEGTLALIADALGVPAVSLFNLAGYIDDTEYKGAAIEEALHLLSSMPVDEQWDVLDLIRLRHRQLEDRKRRFDRE